MFLNCTTRVLCRFVLPSLLYAVNNNIYYAGLMLVPPPIWIILTSFRTVVTASLYKVGGGSGSQYVEGTCASDQWLYISTKV
jgi:hypothetical protein